MNTSKIRELMIEYFRANTLDYSEDVLKELSELRVLNENIKKKPIKKDKEKKKKVKKIKEAEKDINLILKKIINDLGVKTNFYWSTQNKDNEWKDIKEKIQTIDSDITNLMKTYNLHDDLEGKLERWVEYLKHVIDKLEQIHSLKGKQREENEKEFEKEFGKKTIMDLVSDFDTFEKLVNFELKKTDKTTLGTKKDSAKSSGCLMPELKDFWNIESNDWDWKKIRKEGFTCAPDKKMLNNLGTITVKDYEKNSNAWIILEKIKKDYKTHYLFPPQNYFKKEIFKDHEKKLEPYYNIQTNGVLNLSLITIIDLNKNKGRVKDKGFITK